MNSGVIFRTIIEKLDLPNKQDLLNETDKLKEEIPDIFLSVVENASKLFTLDAAKANKELGDYFTQKNNTHLKGIYKNVLKGKQLEEDLIEKLINAELPQILENAITEVELKTKKFASISEDERLEQERRQTQLEREKRERIEKQYADRERRIRDEYEQEVIENKLTTLIHNMSLNNKLDKRDSIKLIKEELFNQLSLRGTCLVKINDDLKVVQTSDKTQQYYDENNNLLDIHKLLNKIASEKGLYETQNYTNNLTNNKTKSYNYVTQSNNNSTTTSSSQSKMREIFGGLNKMLEKNRLIKY